MMVEMPDDIPRLAGQQPRFEGDKGQRMVGLNHRTGVAPVCAFRPEGISSATTGAGWWFAWWMSAATDRAAHCATGAEQAINNQ
jgi:hypothetical protein